MFQIIRINFLGGFIIEQDGNIFSYSNDRKKQLWVLLQYLILNRFNNVSVEQIADVLWKDAEIDNPTNALKNLVYRLRSMMYKIGLNDAYEYIISKNGSYGWNNDLPCIVDIEEIEKIKIKIDTECVTDYEKIKLYREIICTYKGNFLSDKCYDEWVVPIATYYKNMFIHSVKKISELLLIKGYYNEIDLVCSKAITFHFLEEDIHALKMKALIEQDKIKVAIEHYEYISELFYKELGVRPSGEIYDLYKEALHKSKEHNKEEDVCEWINDIYRNEDLGAFYCSLEVFKNIYLLESRVSERCNESNFIAVINLSRLSNNNEKMDILHDAMDCMKQILIHDLRKVDVVARLSTSQFVVILHSLTYTNTKVVEKRIRKKFSHTKYIKEVKLDIQIRPVGVVIENKDGLLL